MAAAAEVEDILLPAADGLRLAARRWQRPLPTPSSGRDRPRVLALHGWLDNACSFDRIAPRLVDALDGADVVALDFPGHGRSDSRPGPLYFLDHVEAVVEALEALAWPACHILGHSLGGNTAVMFAAACPDRVRSLTLIESWGPVTTAPDATVRAMAEALAERRRRLRQPFTKPSFATADEALDRYHRAMATPVARDAAAVVVPRNLAPAAVGGAGDAARWTWAWDDKWLLRSFLPPSEPQVLAMLAALACPVLMLSGAAGYEVARYGGERKQAELAARKRAIRALSEVILPAPIGHYPHLDDPALVLAYLLPHLSSASPAPVQSRL